jgi:hypothetical protein
MLLRTASYNPRTDTWSQVPSAGSPGETAGFNAPAVWTGRELIVWGGVTSTNSSYQCISRGERYDPLTENWQALPTARAPLPQIGQTVIWAGTELWIWGGSCQVSPVLNGRRYNPASDSWRALPDSFVEAFGSPEYAGRFAEGYIGSPPRSWRGYQTVWTGHEFIAVGGYIGFGITRYEGPLLAKRYIPTDLAPSMPRPERWLVVMAPATAFGMMGDPQWIAQPGERYRVRRVKDGWVLALGEQDYPESSVWVQLDDRVQEIAE